MPFRLLQNLLYLFKFGTETWICREYRLEECRDDPGELQCLAVNTLKANELECIEVYKEERGNPHSNGFNRRATTDTYYEKKRVKNVCLVFDDDDECLRAN